MAIVGFSFTRIVAEKRAPVAGKVNISNNVMIASVESANMPGDRTGVRVRFAFESKYEPNLAVIHFEGEVLLLEQVKVAQEILERWQKERALPQPMVGVILNQILDHCNVEALILSRDLQLPPPVPLPKANVNNLPTVKAQPDVKAQEKPVEKKAEQKVEAKPGEVKPAEKKAEPEKKAEAKPKKK